MRAAFAARGAARVCLKGAGKLFGATWQRWARPGAAELSARATDSCSASVTIAMSDTNHLAAMVLQARGRCPYATLLLPPDSGFAAAKASYRKV